MNHDLFAQRLVALFVLGALAFGYPLLTLFSAPRLLFGVPLLSLHLLGAWLAVIALAAWLMRHVGRADAGGDGG